MQWIDQLASKEASSTMADEEAPGNGGGVHDVNAQEIQAGEGDGGSSRVNPVGPKDLQNIRLVIDIGDDRTVEIPLKGKLILQTPQAAAAAGDAAAGNAGQGQSAPDAEDKKFLDKMRGWLMTVGTLFVTMAFQAALQPPAWLQTADFLRYSQSEIDLWNHPFHGYYHAAVAPARFTPSPSPSPQAAESATAGLVFRARAYMGCVYITFGSSLTLVLLLLLKIPTHKAKYTTVVAAFMMWLIALAAVATVVLGTAEDWRFLLDAVFLIAGWAILVACVYILPLIPVFMARIQAWRARWTPAP